MIKQFKQIVTSFVLVSCPFIFGPCTLFAQFTIVPAVTDATCSYDTNGSISLAVSGGALPYTFIWSPGGEATSSITGLGPGTYAATITDNAGMDTTVSYSLGPLPMVNDTTDAIEQPFCTANGIIVLNISGGTSPYQYAWSNGSPNVGITELGAGDYSVVVTDANNCTATFNFTLLETDCFITPEPYFTPNGDDINDTWLIKDSQYFPNARVIIFDRWGTKVYDHKGTYESWNGKSYLGIPVPDAVYYYFFYEDKDDKQKQSKSGSVTIIR